MGDRSEQSDEAEDRQPPRELTGYSFAVAKKVYCCWEWDLTQRNIEFLGSVDTGYYQYLAERLHVDLNGDDAMRASIALRGAYDQGVETLVSLLGAYVQAPEAVPAWLARASTNDLKDVVRCFLDGDSLIAQSGERMVDLEFLADHVHAHAWGDSNGRTATVDRFERFWTRASEDFLSPSFRAEYNSMKHGMRIAPGGFSLSVGVEPSPGVEPQSMKVLGGGRYGSRFFQSQKVGQTSHHMRIQRTSLNWSAVAMAQR